jgi:glutaredoxin-like protein
MAAPQELADAFREAGVDEIACISVNDAFVMDAWKRTQGADRVTLLPDGNGEFTEQMGMLVDKTELGFGRRSWRYSMLVRDGVIEKMFVEPQVPGDPFEVSDADTMLRYLRPQAQPVQDVTIFTKPGCAHCARAKARLRAEGKTFDEVVVGRDVTAKALYAISGARTVPQIFIDGTRIGGADDLEAYLEPSSDRHGAAMEMVAPTPDGDRNEHARNGHAAA